MIALRNVTKRFGNRVALDHVSLTVEPGAMHVLLGSSGSGKSTVLRLILGLLHPDGGDVRVEPVAPMGYVVQDGALYPHLTAARNVCCRRAPRAGPRRVRRRGLTPSPRWW